MHLFQTLQPMPTCCFPRSFPTELISSYLHQIMAPFLNAYRQIDLYHTEAMLSLEENKTLFVCTASLALNSRLAEACRAKTKLFIPPRLNVAAE